MTTVASAIIFLMSIYAASGGIIGVKKADERQNDAQIVQLQQQIEKLQSDLQGIRQNAVVNDKPSDETLPSDRLPIPVRRGVGWQPLKRSGSDTSNPSFRLGFDEPSSLRQQMIDAIEEHLLRDLESARQYGIEPQQILQDLRTKHQRDQD